jgi:hypothetical protein
MRTARGTTPPTPLALLDASHRQLVAVNSLLYDLLKEHRGDSLSIHLETLIDGCDALIERLEEVIAQRDAELRER